MTVQNDNTILNKGDLKAYHEKILPYLGGNMMVSTNNSDYYSTSEKIVGVWIDGKPIYQKTISTSWSSMTSDASYQRHLDLSDPIDTPISISVIMYMNGKALVENGITISDNSTNYSTGVALNMITGTPQIYWTTGNAIADRPGNLIVTIQYTKTTDTAGSGVTTPGAYDINFPNTWPANTEIYFGNGVYGCRCTGTISGAESTVVLTNLKDRIPNPIDNLLNCGGTFVTSSSSGQRYQVGMTYYRGGSGTAAPMGVITYDDSYSFCEFVTTGNGTRTNAPYDIWLTYTK